MIERPNLDSLKCSTVQAMMRSILRIIFEQILQTGQVVGSRHRLPVESEMIWQLVDEEERRLVGVGTEQHGTSFELLAMEQIVWMVRKEYSVNNRNERELHDAPGDPLFVDQQCRWHHSKAFGHRGHVGSSRTAEVIERQF